MSASSFLFSWPSIEEIDAKIESLNHEIARIQADIRCFEEHKNTHLLPVSKLPPEVLSDILESLALGQAPSKPKPEDAYAHPFPATQVCRRWRHIALESPRIWGCIFACAPPRIVRLFLDRAASAPLYLRGSGGFNERSVLAVLNHLDRLKEITLQLGGRNAYSWVRRIALEPTPQLKILSLKHTTKSPADLFQFAADGDAFPALQHLSLSGYIFKASTAATLTNLRTLRISSGRESYRGMQHSTPHHTDPINFFSLLNNLPLLSSLTLANALAPQNQPVPPLSVSLPYLTHLFIEDADIANLGMTACITAPRLKAITLLHKGKADANTAAPIIAAIYASLAPFPPGARSQFELHTRRYITYTTFARVQVWTGGAVEGRESESRVSPLFELEVHGTGNLEAEGPVFALCPPTDVPPAFHYYSDDKDSARDPLSAFRRNVLSGLRCTTDAHFDSMIDVLYALGGDAPAPAIPDTDRADDDAVLALPSLERILLWGNMPILCQETMFARLKQRLRARRAAGAAVRTWVVSPGFLHADDVAEFKGIIDIMESAQVAEYRRRYDWCASLRQ